jgi:hypothetical protein
MANIGAYSTAFGYNTKASGNYATAVGGYGNMATGSLMPFTGGGENNTASGDYTAVVGGSQNIAQGGYTFVGGGAYNVVSGSGSVIGGGRYNTVPGTSAVISGGELNRASGFYSVIPGGESNKAAGAYSFAAGRQAKADHTGSFVWADSQGIDLYSAANDEFRVRSKGGFFINSSSAVFTGRVGIGNQSPAAKLDVVDYDNSDSYVLRVSTDPSVYSLMVSTTGNVGIGEKRPGQALVVIGSATFTETVTANALVTNGLVISTGGAITTIGQGYGPVLSDQRGIGAVDLQTYRTVVTRVASGLYSSLLGGMENTSSGNYAVIGGGGSNISSNTYTVVGGGSNNSAGNLSAFVGGGDTNQSHGQYASISGGSLNKISAGWGAISGGNGNVVTGNAPYGFIGGGQNNVVNSQSGTVSGGSSNWAGQNAVVGGGYGNIAYGQYSSIPGGFGNFTKYNYSFAAGYASSSAALGTFTWADGTGVTVDNSGVNNRTWFKNAGGFLVTTSTQPSADGNMMVGAITGSTFTVQVNGDLALGNGNISANKPVTIWLYNNSGAARSYGEIVVIDSLTDRSFNCTSVASTTTVVGVVYDTTIAVGAVGRIAIHGVVQIKTGTQVTRGQAVITSGTSCQAGVILNPAAGTSIGKWLQTINSGFLADAVLLSQ